MPCLLQTGDLMDQAPIMSRTAVTAAYLFGQNVPRQLIYKMSQTPGGVRS